MSDNEWPRQSPNLDHDEWGDHPSHPRRLLLSIALVLAVLLAAGGVAWQLMRNGSAQPTAQPSAAPVASASQLNLPPCPDAELTVVAAPEIEPLIREAAAGLHPAGQRCAPITVRAEEPGITAAAKEKPDLWVPSSSAWLRVAAASGGVYTAAAEPLAYSPILLAAPEDISSLYVEDGTTSWTGLIKGATEEKFPTITMPDPERSTTGLLSVHGVYAATARTTPDQGIAQLRALTLRSRLEESAADPAALLTKMAGQVDATTAVYEIGIFPVIEQQLLAYQKGRHPVRLAGVPPADGRVEADYPWAVRKGADKAVADRLRAAITPESLTEAGFRDEPTAGALRLPDRVNRLLGPVRQWSQYQELAFRVLLLIDSSGSMNEKVTDRAGRSLTKAELLRESGASASELFSDDTTIGMWYFGSAGQNAPAHTEEVPLGPIGDSVGDRSRREALTTKIQSYQPQASAGTPLYQAVLDGVSTMRDGVAPETATVVVVLTDGADGGTKFAMSNQDFQKKLQAVRDPARPVPVIAVGFGPDANMPALQSMAKATGGKAIAAKNPADLASAMAQAFLAAHTTK